MSAPDTKAESPTVTSPEDASPPPASDENTQTPPPSDEEITIFGDSIALPSDELPAVAGYLVLHGSFSLGDQRHAGPGSLVSLTAAEAKLALENGTVKRT